LKKSGLNHTFRIIWSEALQCYIAVAEFVKSNGKKAVVSAAIALSVLGVSPSGVQAGAYNFLDPAYTASSMVIGHSDTYFFNVIDTSGSLTNAGTISALAYDSHTVVAIGAAWGRADSDTVSALALINSGTISAQMATVGTTGIAAGVAVIGNFFGSLDNSGLIKVVQSGPGNTGSDFSEIVGLAVFDASKLSSAATNFFNISPATAGGVDSFASIVNSGTILGSVINKASNGNLNVAGVSVEGNFAGSLTNAASGHILALGTSIGGGGGNFNAINLQQALSGSIQNDGTILASVETVFNSPIEARGISVDGALITSGLITNSTLGLIKAFVSSHSTANVNAIYVGSNLQGSIVNQGTIEAGIDAAWAAPISVSSSYIGSLNKAVGIEVGQFTIASEASHPANSADISGVVDNQGTISAHIRMETAATAWDGSKQPLFFRAYGIQAIDLSGAINNSGSILATINVYPIEPGASRTPDGRSSYRAAGVDIANEFGGDITNAGTATIRASVNISQPNITVYGNNTYDGGGFAYAAGIHNGLAGTSPSTTLGVFSGNITNHGAIEATVDASATSNINAFARGIHLYSVDTRSEGTIYFTGTIANSGDIIATADGLESVNASGLLIEHGTHIHLINSVSGSIVGDASAFNNTDQVSAYAINMDGLAGANSAIENSGLVRAYAERFSTYGYSSINTITAAGLKINGMVAEDAGGIFNNSGGTIQAYAHASDAKALALGLAVNELRATLGNSGIISAAATATNTPQNYSAAIDAVAKGVVVDTIYAGTLSLTSTIGASPPSTITSTTVFQGALENSGTIQAVAYNTDRGGAEAYGVQVKSIRGLEPDFIPQFNFINDTLASIGATAIALGTASRLDQPHADAFGVYIGDGGITYGRTYERSIALDQLGDSHTLTMAALGFMDTEYFSGTFTYTDTTYGAQSVILGKVVNGEIVIDAIDTLGTAILNHPTGVTLTSQTDEFSSVYTSLTVSNISDDFSNAGRIHAQATNLSEMTAHAFGVAAGTLSGNFMNSGTIDATATGVAVDSHKRAQYQDQSYQFVLLFSGSGYGIGARGVYLKEIDGTFANSGSIAATVNLTADGAEGGVDFGSSNGHFNNVIAVHVDGIDTGTGQIAGDFNNSGHIVAQFNVDGSLVTSPLAQTSSFNATGFSVNDLGGTFSNSGSIVAGVNILDGNNLGSEAYVRAVDIGGTLGGDFINSTQGMIAAYVSNAGYGSAGGVKIDYLSGSFINDGTIIAEANGHNNGNNESGGNFANAVDLQGFVGSSTSIVNTGYIYAEAAGNFSGRAMGIGIWDGAPSDNITLSNLGTISAVADGGEGAAAYGIHNDTAQGLVNGTLGMISASASVTGASSRLLQSYAEAFAVYSGGYTTYQSSFEYENILNANDTLYFNNEAYSGTGDVNFLGYYNNNTYVASPGSFAFSEVESITDYFSTMHMSLVNLHDMEDGFDNQGTLYAAAANLNGITAHAFGLAAGTLSGGFTNSGLIDAVASGKSSDSHRNIDDQTFSSSPNNNNSSGTANFGLGARGVYLSELNGNFENSGTIRATNNLTADGGEGNLSQIYNFDTSNQNLSGAVAVHLAGNGTDGAEGNSLGGSEGNILGNFNNSGDILARTNVDGASVTSFAFSPTSGTTNFSFSNAHGILAYNLNGTFTNSGTISASMIYSNAIYLTSIALAEGIVFGGNVAGDFINTSGGRIVGQVSNALAGFAGAVTLDTLSGSFTNQGTIIASASNQNNFEYDGAGYDGAEGVIINDITGPFINGGYIGAFASGQGTSNSALGLNITSSSSSILNSGVILASADGAEGNATALQIGSSQGEIRNLSTGKILAYASGTLNSSGTSARAIEITGSLTHSVINEGTIYARSSATGTLGNSRAEALRVDTLSSSSILNSGLMWASSLDHPEEGFAIYAENANVAHISNLGRMFGNLFIDGSVNFMNSGSIQLPNELSQATIGVESSSYLQTATGTLGIRVTSTDSYSTLKVGGIATFEDDATIEVHAQGASLRKGDRLLGVVTAETVVASSITVTHPNSMFVFAPVYHANSIELNVLQSLSVLTAVTNNGNIKAIPSATVFDDMIANNSGSSDMQNVINALSNLPDEAAISNAVSKTLPLVTGGLTKNTLNMVRDTSRIVSARQESLSGQASGSEFYGNKNFWFKPYASFGSQDDKAGISGFDSKTYGMIFGADQKFSPKDQIGFALNYARANVDANNESTAKQSASSNNYLIALYGSHDLDRGRELTYIADVGQQNIRGNRAINIDSLRRTAKADYSSWSGHVGLGLKQTNQWTDNTNFTTSVRYDYAYVKDDAYQEKGADALNLNVNKASMYESLGSLDGKISHGLTPSLNLIVNAGLSYDFNNQSTRVNSAFAGAPNLAFTTDGLSYGRLSERLGVGLVNKNSKNFEFSARYDYETRSHYNNQMGSLKAVWYF
jgi:hypothetical protein